jgi:spore germination protein Q
MAHKNPQANPYSYYGAPGYGDSQGYPYPGGPGYGGMPSFPDQGGAPGYAGMPGYTDPSAAYNPYAQPGGPILQPGAPNVGAQNPAAFVPGMLPLEESYIENILRLNKGKLAKVYMTFGDKQQKAFTGIVEAAGRDHIILSDPQTGMRYLLLMVYLDYVTFDEELEYEYPYGAAPQMAAYPPR